MLLVGAGLLIRSFVRLLGTDAGFDAERVLALDIPLSRSKYPQPEQQAAAFRQLVERMRAVPGVREAGVVSNLPLSNLDYELSFRIEGRPPSRPGEEPSADYTVAGADYFSAMKMRLLRGRLFDDRDTPQAPAVLVVSDAFARRFFPGEDPLGRRILFDGTDGKHPPREIVGVVGDVRRGGLDVEAEPEVYVSYLQSPERRLNLVLGTETPDAASLTQAARAAVREFDPNQLIWRTQTMDELLGKSLAPRRFNMMLLAIFAGVALVLAGVGLYGVMSYTVTWRTHEIGIRMALGAQRGDVLRLVVSQGLALTLVGVALGLACALALSRVLTSLLFGISATDPLTYAGVALLLVAVALVACLVPARRATKVDPMVALRYE
jgi:putative ABC transport system permease protein